jgi:hypothetical protein
MRVWHLFAIHPYFAHLDDGSKSVAVLNNRSSNHFFNGCALKSRSSGTRSLTGLGEESKNGHAVMVSAHGSATSATGLACVSAD